ncbi:MAG TPA: AHH domain-containing protein [Dyella sp.]|uniref:AHH domain-containing protein n=1 Tax=Dyella sp. TaxID=1869338 RepID=UPI002B716A74|nr:AHH domain-containing protein [Dyella sp.]HTV87030.1 AHH domain-containing protein [Dyella sp.]
MAFDEGKNPSSQPDLDMVALRIGANQVAGGAAAYEAGNEAVIKKTKRETLYKNGFTLSVTAERLIAEAERTTRHSAKLARNMKAAGQLRPSDAGPKTVSTHHVVAATDDRAFESRKKLFRWGIGINDVDNGVYLPAFENSTVSSLPRAVKHAVVHTDVYHVNVFARFVMIPNDGTARGRVALRQIKQELIDGVFPY